MKQHHADDHHYDQMHDGRYHEYGYSNFDDYYQHPQFSKHHGGYYQGYSNDYDSGMVGYQPHSKYQKFSKPLGDYSYNHSYGDYHKRGKQHSSHNKSYSSGSQDEKNSQEKKSYG